jgi:hypothetical protein
MMEDELGINQETIRQVLREDLRRREHLSKVRPTETHGLAEATETHIMTRLHPDLSRQSQFYRLHFLF